MRPGGPLPRLGYNECVTYSFIDGADAAKLFGGGSEAVRIENPISSEMTHLRPDLLPGLLAGGGAQSGARLHGPEPLLRSARCFHGGEPGRTGICMATALFWWAPLAPRDPLWLAAGRSMSLM